LVRTVTGSGLNAARGRAWRVAPVNVAGSWRARLRVEGGASYVVADAPRRWRSVSRGRCSRTARGAGRCQGLARRDLAQSTSRPHGSSGEAEAVR
jgi:hypothetical protein